MEIGVEWVTEYDTGPAAGMARPSARGNAETLKDIVDDPDTGWGWQFSYGEDLAWERDFKDTSRLGGDDDYAADDVDLVAWAGHGWSNKFVFQIQMDDWYAETTEMDLGDKDAEWLLAFTCHFLEGSNRDVYGRVCDGLHSICGYRTDMTLHANGGTHFSNWAIMSYTVKSSWVKYAQETQPDGNGPSVFTAKPCAEDHLWRYGTVSSDPGRYWDNKSNYVRLDYNT